MQHLQIDETHSPELRSWVESANDPASDFPIQNLPYGVFRRAGTREAFRGGVAIGDAVVDLAAASEGGVFEGLAAEPAAACRALGLNAFMEMGSGAWSALRWSLSRALRDGAPQRGRLQDCLVAQRDVEYALPARIGDYTDFYVGIHHATAVGHLFRPDNPLLPNYKWIPIGYHGRASTINISGHRFPRPLGQLKGPSDEVPYLAPTQRLDFELELGAFIGRGNRQGQPIPIEDAEKHVFGIVMLNDWSARDIQAWEYQPLGPFLSKNFATTISPWIVTMDALAPFRRPLLRRESDPQPLPYLDSAVNRTRGALDVSLEVHLQTAAMRDANVPAQCISRSNFAEAAYWTVAQLVAHHTVNGCSLQSGDLFGTGTLSGPAAAQAGSLLELTQGGKRPITLADGEQRTFLVDGDALTLTGYCERPGFRRIGFGACTAVVDPPVRVAPGEEAC